MYTSVVFFKNFLIFSTTAGEHELVRKKVFIVCSFDAAE
jgi:hypothetical protein